MELSEAKRLRELGNENGRLKRAVADSSLDREALKWVIEKKRLEIAAERETVVALQERFTKKTERRAYGLVDLSRSSFRYEGERRAGNEELTATLKTLALEQPRHGYRRLAVLAKRGSPKTINEKRIRRLYRLAGLAPRKLKRKRIQRAAGAGYLDSERPSDTGVGGGDRRIR